MIYFRSVLCFLFLPLSSFGVDYERRSASSRSCPCPVGTSNVDCASQACPSEYSACGLELLEEYEQEGNFNWAGIRNAYISYQSRWPSKTWTSSVLSGPSTYYYPSHKSPVVIDGKNQYEFQKYRVRLVHDITGVQLTFDANICVNPKITYVDRESMLSLFETFPHDYAIALKIISVNGNGIQFFHNSYVGGAYGGKDYIDTGTASIGVMMHEVGHTLQQHRRITHGDSGVTNPAWRRAIECDDIRTSGYGNNNEWEDVAEFAKMFAFSETKKSLSDQSPERFFLWSGTVAIAQDAYPPEQLLGNPGFENGVEGWYGFGTGEISAQTSVFRSGSAAAWVSGRQLTGHGIAVRMPSVLTDGRSYRISAWFRLGAGAADDRVAITVKQTDGSGTRYIFVAAETAAEGRWQHAEGDFALDVEGTLDKLVLYFEGPAPGTDFYLDDAEVVALNLLENPGFERGLGGWSSFCSATISVADGAGVRGSAAALVSDRTMACGAIGTEMKDTMTPGKTYSISARFRLKGSSDDAVVITVKQQDGSGTKYLRVGAETATDDVWTLVEGDFTPSVTGGLTKLFLYFGGPAPGTDFYLDGVRVLERPHRDWRREANDSIARIRMRDVRVAVEDASGAPVEARVAVRQVRSAFAFGTAVGGRLGEEGAYREFVGENFEWAVPENEAKWYHNERVRGVVTYEELDAMYGFCADRGITMRGHAVLWAVEKHVQDWVQALGDDDLRTALEGRISSVVGRYAGNFPHWDVNNEMLHGSFFQDRLGPDTRKWIFDKVKEADPEVMSFVNDYNVVSRGETDEYYTQIKDLLDAGAKIDGIGVQGHFGATVDPYEVQSRLNTLAQLGLPIWVTEYDAVNPDPDARADALEKLYRTAYAHPAVGGVLMWGFWAGKHWRGPDAAIVDLDWTVNAAGKMYQRLMKEWKTEVVVDTAEGAVEFRGFQGKYELSVTVGDDRPTQTHEIYLEPGEGVAQFTVTLRKGTPSSAPTALPSSVPSSELSGPPSSPPSVDQNMVDNPGFEKGLEGWDDFGWATISVQSVHKRSGSSAALIGGRDHAYSGIATTMTDRMEVGESYAVSVWMRLPDGVTDDSGAKVVMKIVDTRGTRYVRIGPTATITDSGWTEVGGHITLPDAGGTPTELVMYFSGPLPGTDFYADDVRVVREKQKCEDNPTFSKNRGGKKRTCKYIGKGDKLWRINKWCKKKKRGILISNFCCKTCTLCTKCNSNF